MVNTAFAAAHQPTPSRPYSYDNAIIGHCSEPDGSITRDRRRDCHVVCQYFELLTDTIHSALESWSRQEQEVWCHIPIHDLETRLIVCTDV